MTLFGHALTFVCYQGNVIWVHTNSTADFHPQRVYLLGSILTSRLPLEMAAMETQLSQITALLRDPTFTDVVIQWVDQGGWPVTSNWGKSWSKRRPVQQTVSTEWTCTCVLIRCDFLGSTVCGGGSILGIVIGPLPQVAVSLSQSSRDVQTDGESGRGRWTTPGGGSTIWFFGATTIGSGST